MVVVFRGISVSFPFSDVKGQKGFVRVGFGRDLDAFEMLGEVLA
jgi:hypothetical protein